MKRPFKDMLFPFNNKTRAFFQSPIEDCHVLKLSDNSLIDLLALTGEKQSAQALENDYLDGIRKITQTIFIDENNIEQKNFDNFISFALSRITSNNLALTLELSELPSQEKFDFVKGKLNNHEFVLGYIPLYFNDNTIVYCELALSKNSGMKGNGHFLDFRAYPMLAKTDGISTQFYNLDSYIYASEFDNKELIKAILKSDGLHLFATKSGGRLNSIDMPKDITFRRAKTNADFNAFEELDDLKDVFGALLAENPIAFRI